MNNLFAILGVLTLVGCSSLPPTAMLSIQGKTALVSLSVDKSVAPLGVNSDDTGPGFLADAAAYKAPLSQGTEAWAKALIVAWRSLPFDSVNWSEDSSLITDYNEAASLERSEVAFGLSKGDAVRSFVPAGWSYLGEENRSALAALATKWGLSGTWTINAQAYYVLDDSHDTTYHLTVRHVVRLFGTDGVLVARYDVMAYSDSHPYSSANRCRGELPTTLREAAYDFQDRWKKLLSQKSN